MQADVLPSQIQIFNFLLSPSFAFILLLKLGKLLGDRLILIARRQQPFSHLYGHFILIADYETARCWPAQCGASLH